MTRTDDGRVDGSVVDWILLFSQLISRLRERATSFTIRQGQQTNLKYFGKESNIICIFKICTCLRSKCCSQTASVSCVCSRKPGLPREETVMEQKYILVALIEKWNQSESSQIKAHTAYCTSIEVTCQSVLTECLSSVLIIRELCSLPSRRLREGQRTQPRVVAQAPCSRR